MTPQDSTPDRDRQLRALHEGRAFVDRSGWRSVLVTGDDASRWLHDLITADVAALAPGGAARSLLLTPTGRIRADVHVIRLRRGHLLVQDPQQPEPIDALLAPYVLSSDVALADRTGEIALLCSTGDGLALNGAEAASPSLLGAGTDLVGPASRRAELAGRLRDAGVLEVDEPAVDAWRVLRGDPRFGVDVEADALPAEAGLEWTIDLAKGCFLGQESVARVRNLGHPPRVLLALRAAGRVRPGAVVTAADRQVGRVTSTTGDAAGTVLLALVRWEAREEPLRAEGERLRTA